MKKSTLKNAVNQAIVDGFEVFNHYAKNDYAAIENATANELLYLAEQFEHIGFNLEFYEEASTEEEGLEFIGCSHDEDPNTPLGWSLEKSMSILRVNQLGELARTETDREVIYSSDSGFNIRFIKLSPEPAEEETAAPEINEAFTEFTNFDLELTAKALNYFVFYKGGQLNKEETHAADLMARMMKLELEERNK